MKEPGKGVFRVSSTDCLISSGRIAAEISADYEKALASALFCAIKVQKDAEVYYGNFI